MYIDRNIGVDEYCIRCRKKNFCNNLIVLSVLLEKPSYFLDIDVYHCSVFISIYFQHVGLSKMVGTERVLTSYKQEQPIAE